MKNVATIITIILLGFIPHLNATELSDALKYGGELGWNHKDTYRPYPILFIHGIGGHCTGWTDPDSSTFDLRPDPDDGMISKLLPYFEPYFKTKPDKKEKFSSDLEDITLSNKKKAKVYNKTYLETVEFSDNDGSIETQTQELWHRIMGAKEATSKSCDAHNYTIGLDVEGFEPLLQEYYPFRLVSEDLDIYEFQPEDKVILVGHSMGGVVARDYLTSPAVDGNRHVDRCIMVHSPNLGAPIALALRSDIIDNIISNIPFSLGLSIIGKSTVSKAPEKLPTKTIKKALIKKALLIAVAEACIKKISTILFALSLDINPFTSEALVELSPNSTFLTTLNNRAKPIDVEYRVLSGAVHPSDSLDIGASEFVSYLTNISVGDKRSEKLNEIRESLKKEIDNLLGELSMDDISIKENLENIKKRLPNLYPMPTIYAISSLKVEQDALKNYYKDIPSKVETLTDIPYLPYKIKTLQNELLKIIELLDEILILAHTLIDDKSDAIVPLYSQQFLTTDGGQLSTGDVSYNPESVFHVTFGPIRGAYDGKVNLENLLKLLDNPPQYSSLKAGIEEIATSTHNYIIEAKCYDFLPASTTVTLMLNGKVICDKNGKTIKDRPLSPLPLTKRYSHITEDGKYNSGFSFVINKNIGVKPRM